MTYSGPPPPPPSGTVSGIWLKAFSPARPGKKDFSYTPHKDNETLLDRLREIGWRKGERRITPEPPLHAEGVPVPVTYRAVAPPSTSSMSSSGAAESVCSVIDMYSKIQDSLTAVKNESFCNNCEIRSPVYECGPCGGYQLCPSCFDDIHKQKILSSHKRILIKPVHPAAKPEKEEEEQEEEQEEGYEEEETIPDSVCDQLTLTLTPRSRSSSLPFLPPVPSVSQPSLSEELSLESALQAMALSVKKLETKGKDTREECPVEEVRTPPLHPSILELFDEKETPPDDAATPRTTGWSEMKKLRLQIERSITTPPAVKQDRFVSPLNPDTVLG
eukprot:TRINITY_DN6900_c0_g1_i1.p1 TRINITY_DN6900_c0_g1~~TRINITY_DN6900_c0_g1_i1.p1  ORF type:complete len:331 (+),score=81.48 TRINITY_DN6900_c0_g1_i1:68-1060(+)